MRYTSELEDDLRGSLIWERLRDVRIAVGARRPVASARTLWFVVGPSTRRATYKIMISREPGELYTVTHTRVDRATWATEELSRVECVRLEDLADVVTAVCNPLIRKAA